MRGEPAPKGDEVVVAPEWPGPEPNAVAATPATPTTADSRLRLSVAVLVLSRQTRRHTVQASSPGLRHEIVRLPGPAPISEGSGLS